MEHSGPDAVQWLLILVVLPSSFGIPGLVIGWVTGRHGYRSIAGAGLGFGVLGVLIVSLGWSTAHEDPLGAWAVLVLLAILVINACTAVAGVGLARHVASRDAHID